MGFNRETMEYVVGIDKFRKLHFEMHANCFFLVSDISDLKKISWEVKKALLYTEDG